MIEKLIIGLIPRIEKLRENERKYSPSWNYYHGYVTALQDIQKELNEGRIK